MNSLVTALMLVATIAFIGVGVYTVVGGWHALDSADFGGGNRPTRREILARIPKPIRKLGIISLSVFIGCLAVLSILILLSK